MAIIKLPSGGTIQTEEEKVSYKLPSGGTVVAAGNTTLNKIKPTPLPKRVVQNQSQSNNPPSVSKQTGSNAVNVAKNTTVKQQPKQLGIGFNQPTVTKPQPLPYAGKLSASLPQYKAQTLQKAQQISKNAQGKTSEQLRHQNLQNLKSSAAESARSFAYGAERMGAGVLGFGENIVDFAGATGAKIMGLDDAQKAWATRENYADKWKQNIEKRYNPTDEVRFAGDITETVAPLLVTGTLGTAGAAGASGIGAASQIANAQTAAQIAMGVNAAGAGMQEAATNGATADQAIRYGIATGLLEVTIESIAGNLPGLPKGKVTEIIEAAKGSPLLASLADIVGEGGEEALSTFITPYIQRAMYDPDAQNATGEEIWNSAVMGMVAGSIMQAGGGNINLGLKQNSNANVEVDSESQKSYLQQIDDVMTGKASRSTDIVVGDTPEILLQYGANPHKLSMKQSSVRKIAYPSGYMGGQHNLGFYALEQLPAQLADPVAVLKSSSQDNSLVVFTEFLDDHNNPVMIPLHLDKKGNLNVSNEVASMYGRGNFDSFIAAERAAGNVLYEKTNRALQDLPTVGLQLPKADAYTDPISKTRIAQTGINVKSATNPAQLPPGPGLQHPQQLPYAPGYNAAETPTQPALPMASEVNARQQEDFESFWFGHPELSEQDAMRLYEEQQRKSQAEKPVSPVSSDSGKMPQRERRQAWNYADKVKKEFDLDIDDKSLRGDIESLFSDVRKNGWTAENEARLQEISKRMVEKSNGVLNEAESRPARDAKRFIRGTKLYITPSIKAEIEHNHGNYNAFRKKHMGKLDMKLVDSEAHPGQSIDAYYTELSDIAPEWFPAKDSDTNDKDMLEQIIWFVDEDTDVYDHPFESDPEGAAEFIAGRIKEGYTDLFTNQDVDIEKAKQAFVREVNAKKALEATEKKAALSSDEKEIVSAMLKGQINPDSVTDQRIRSVYEARAENYAAQRDSRAARRNLRSRYKDLAQDFAEYSSGWKDKVRGWFFDMETAERNIRDVIPDKELAERFIEQYITPLHTNEAEATRLKNELRDRLKKLNLGTKAVHRITPDGGKSGLYSESAIVQMYGEGLVNEQQVKMSGADVDKVKNAVSEFRQVYDQLLDMANEVLVANGYAPVEKRANYFPHWQEPEPTGVRKVLAKMGMKILGDDLPTDIAGITDTFRPGKKFVANYLRRQGNQTEYDALKGFDIYIDSVADVIFHTDDIQRLRALETEIRYQASDTGVQSRVRDIMEDPYLDEDAKSEAVRKILEEDRTSLAHFVNWLRKYTDTLAGKKNFSDRDWEYKVGRDLYETMKAVEGRISANMVGGNISSAMTNLIPIFQGTGEVRAKYIAQAMKDAARSAIRYDGFADRSDFLTNRLGSDKLMKTGLEKATSVASKPFELVDRFASETLTRAKYMQNVDAGMDVDAAMADADAWAASLMADRSKGAVPLVFTEKNPVTKAFTMFQLEVNNQFRYMMKDLPRNMQDQGKAAIVGALMKIFIATGLYGELFKGLAGYDPTFNPLSLLRELIEGLSDEEKKKSEVITDFAVDAAKEIPFVGNVLGGGRLPVSNVSEGIKETANSFLKYGTGEQSGKAFLNTLGNSAGSTAAMLLLPMGGNQLKKTAQGLTAVARGKVTTTDNEGNEKIKYLVDQTPGNAVRGALFGQWSFPEAREYVDGGFKMTNAKASDVINRAEEEAGIQAKTAMSVYKSMAGLGTKSYKLEKIFSNNDLTPDQMAWLERELLNDGERGMADQAIAAGVSPKLFYDIVTGANQDNKGGTSQTETLKELVRRNDLTNNQKGDIYYQMASDSQQGKMNKAKQNGISHAQWYQYMVKADSNRDGNVTQEEAKDALDSMNLSLEKKAYIWKLEGWNDKKNPYK